MDAVARILLATTHYDVLGFEQPLETETSAVRRKYRELAIQVHPDKNRAEGAEAAFKRLSEAYECLADAQTQRSYLVALTQRSAPRRSVPAPPARPPWPPRKPKKAKSKKNPGPPPPPPPPPPPRPPSPSTSETPRPPRRWRTPEEIWALFQREEEEQARRAFQSNGCGTDTRPNKRSRREAEENAASGDGRDPMQATGGVEVVVDDVAVESRAREWTAWKRTRVEKKSDGVAVNAETTTPSSESRPTATPPATTAACCLVCRRKFPSEAALARHEQLSALHQTNLSLRVQHQQQPV